MLISFGLILIWLKFILELVQIKRVYMLSSYEKIGFLLAILISFLLSWRSFSIMIRMSCPYPRFKPLIVLSIWIPLNGMNSRMVVFAC